MCIGTWNDPKAHLHFFYHFQPFILGVGFSLFFWTRSLKYKSHNPNEIYWFPNLIAWTKFNSKREEGVETNKKKKLRQCISLWILLLFLELFGKMDIFSQKFVDCNIIILLRLPYMC